MRTVTHKFACLYLKIKFKDNLKTHETEQLIKRLSKLVHRANSTAQHS